MCCNNNSSNVAGCCSSKTNTFSWNNATIMPRADLAGSLGTVTLTRTATLVSSAGGSTVIAPATSAAASSSPATSTALATTTPAAVCSNHEVAIGAGLGVPLAISLLALAFMGGLLIRQRKASAAYGGTSNPVTAQYQPVNTAISPAPVYEPKYTPMNTSELGNSGVSNRYHGASELAN